MFRNILCISLLSGLLCAELQASIVLNNTRVIYNATAREVTIPLTNRSSAPVLVQSWLDNGDAVSSPVSTGTPFIIIPPITRVDGGKSQTLRLMAVNVSGLPRDRESVFWLNVLDVPLKLSAKESNRLQVALQTRIKLFYRPEGLQGRPEQAVQGLIWRSEEPGMTVSNPGRRFISLVSVASGNNVWAMDMIKPDETRRVDAHLEAGAPLKVAWIDDNGATQLYDTVTR